MNRRDGLSTYLESALACGGLPRNPTQVVGRLFCLIYVAPLTHKENDKRFYKYYRKPSFEEYMQQSLSDESEERDEVDPEEYMLFEEAIYGTITGITLEGVQQSCWLQINRIDSDRGIITSIHLGDGDEMSRIYPDIDETSEQAKADHCKNGLPCSITLL